MVNGRLLMEENLDAGVSIKGNITGLSPGKHGFYIHEYGDIAERCNTAGGHLNPFNVSHTSPKEPVSKRHVADLGNIIANEVGRVVIDIKDKLITLHGIYSVIGRTFFVHAMEDDLGRGNNDESLKTENAGPRVGCGIIGIIGFD